MRQRAVPSREQRAVPSRNQTTPTSRPRTAGKLTRASGADRSSPPLQSAISTWLRDGEAQGWTSSTSQSRESNLRRILWWVEHEAQLPLVLASLTPSSIREFLAYLRKPADSPRWGAEGHAGALKLMRPGGVATYYRDLKSFLNFCVREGLIDETPCRKVTQPRVPKETIEPFTQEQVEALISAGRRLPGSERNAALMVLLLDTGLRIAEACSLSVGDLDRAGGCVSVVGKGRSWSIGRGSRVTSHPRSVRG